MAMAGMIREELRLPLVPMSAENRMKLVAALKACPLLRKRKS